MKIPRTASPLLAAFVAALLTACSAAQSPAPESRVNEATPSPAAASPVDAGNPPGPAPERVWGEGAAMGTHLGFAAYTNDNVNSARAKELFQLAIEEIKRIETLMTTWRADSELSRVNAAAGKSAVVVSEETLRVVKEAIHTSEISEGTFDITFEGLHGLWKFDQDLDPHPPKAEDVRAKLPLVNFRHIKIDDAQKSIMLDAAGVKISLGGIAKGYAVDRAAEVLEKGGRKIGGGGERGNASRGEGGDSHE